MPKETIYNRPAPDGETAPTTQAVVGWCRHTNDDGHHVQVGVLEPGTGDSPSVGMYVSLDADGIRRMRRALKRASRKAFGV